MTRHTAEGMLAQLREHLIAEISFADTVLRPLYERAPEAQQVLMVGKLDRACEAERLLGALAVAKAHLERSPVPHHDPLPHPITKRRRP